MYSVFSDEYFMNIALKEAEKGMEENEVPIGALIINENKIIAKAHNQTEKLNDVTAHAEIIAYTAAVEFFGTKYLNHCTLYITLEPCFMCAGMIKWAQFKKIVFGATDLKYGFGELNAKILHPKTEIVSGILEKQCAEILSSFFAQKRNK